MHEKKQIAAQDDLLPPVVLESDAGIRTVAEQFPAFCAPVFRDVSGSRNSLLAQLSAQMPNAINVVQTANSASAYKVVNGITLQRGSDGLFSGVVRDKNGHIIEHVKLEKASSGFTQAAFFTYSALNAVVGQANMMSIAKSLESIETALDEAKKRDYDKLITVIDNAKPGFKEALCLTENELQIKTILDRRHELRGALMNLQKFIQREIIEMPICRKKGFWEDLFSNWGLERSTLPEQAKKRFEYIAWAFPKWYEGVALLLLSDAYVAPKEGFCSSAEFATDGLKNLFINSRISDRMGYVPMIGKADPIDSVSGIVQAIPKMEHTFTRVKKNADSGNLAIEIKAD